jgi:hypothetical protein
MTSTGFGQSAAPGRILVVDADEQISTTIKTQFAPEGFEVDWCGSSAELYNIDVDLYSLVVVDIEIEENQGISLIEQLKQTSGRDNMPVIACSRRMSPSIVVAALNAGADDYVLKPFSLRELMARVHAVLRR